MGGLKRHPALQPFSRDHLIGLFHAQRLMKLKADSEIDVLTETITAFEDAWKREITVHFADEDRLLGDLAIGHRQLERLHDEHVDLTNLIEQLFKRPFNVAIAHEVGTFLDAHIRWEEHDLFPEIESTLSEEELTLLSKETDVIEKARNRKLL
jgi:hypothetical protein